MVCFGAEGNEAAEKRRIARAFFGLLSRTGGDDTECAAADGLPALSGTPFACIGYSRALLRVLGVMPSASGVFIGAEWTERKCRGRTRSLQETTQPEGVSVTRCVSRLRETSILIAPNTAHSLTMPVRSRLETTALLCSIRLSMLLNSMESVRRVELSSTLLLFSCHAQPRRCVRTVSDGRDASTERRDSFGIAIPPHN